MADYLGMNTNSGNICCDVVSAKKHVVAKELKTPKITDRHGVNVDGVKLCKGDVNATNLKLDGNLEIGGVITGARDALPLTDEQIRREQAYQNRVCAAQQQYVIPLPTHDNNGDEDLYPNRIGNYSKGFLHNALGEVDPDAYDEFAAAAANPYLFDSLTLVGGRKLVNPLCGIAFDTEGADSHALRMPPSPAFASAERASEIVENYWMALLRDVEFRNYGTDLTVAQACADLNTMSDYRGLKSGGLVTTQTLFRGKALGCDKGPYLSQFFYVDCPYGANEINQKARVPVAGDDFMTNFTEWKFIQEGNVPVTTQTFDPTRRYMRNGRDLSEWVHIDQLTQAYLIACMILKARGCPFNPGNPYRTGHSTQQGFGTFGGPEIIALVNEVSSRALKAVWYQKWYVHRVLRPEAYAGRIDRHKNNFATYPIHSDALNSAVLPVVFGQYGSYLLPMAFPEGSPLHPSYGSGHATVAGACTTVLKAFFDTENFIMADPKQPNAGGTALSNYIGDPLSAEGELNKVAANVAIGRNIAGVHWNSDADESLKLGEQVAIQVLRDHKKMYHPAENYAGYTFRKFDGTRVTI